MYAILAQCPLFRGLTAEQIRETIGERGEFSLTEYKDKDCIAHRDTAYSGLMIILKGRVHGEMVSGGKTIVVDPIAAPQLLAPAFLFGGYNKLPIDVIADGDVTIMTLHRGYIFELMQANVLIMSNFIDIISNRANVWSKKIFFLSFRSLKEKVATYLLEHTSEESGSVPVPDIREIAEYFDATRSALQTVLMELEKKHLIRSEASSIAVLNRKGLRDILK